MGRWSLGFIGGLALLLYVDPWGSPSHLDMARVQWVAQSRGTLPGRCCSLGRRSVSDKRRVWQLASNSRVPRGTCAGDSRLVV